MRKRFFLAAAVFIASLPLVFGQELPQLPNDPATRVGKLDNGLTYYIRHNDKPENRAEFYLATDVGAIQETPDQDGLAHFLEHMCFNGTKNFPGKGILNWLESIGASFGGNVNASTGVEQTIYLLNNIPLVRPTVVDTCLLIMHDYSHFVTCAPEEIDKERGVILEERRSRNDASWRTREAAGKYIFGDSKYANCTVIGSEENLKTFKPESLTSFYHTWYRPDMQALIVIGDVDVDETEAKIKEIFADIPATENPKAKDVIKVPDNKEPIVGIVTDPETSSTAYQVLWKYEARPEEMNSTPIGLLTDLVQSVITQVMAERFNDISAKADAPFLNAGIGIGSYVETMEVTLGQVVCKDGDSLVGLEALLTEIEKMRRFGFTDAEVERAKTEILSQYESAAKKADTRKNSEFVWPIINHFFDNYAFMDPQAEYETVQTLMANITAPVLNQVAQGIITRENMVVVYTGPEREGVVTPTEADVLAVIAKVENAEIEQVAGEEIPDSFIDASTLKGSAVKKSGKGIYGSEVFTLKNGLKVILYPTDYEKDAISFTLTKKGGRSLISDEDLYSFDDNIWSLYLQNSGIAGFSSTTVSKMLAGKQLSVNPYISTYAHGISGRSTKKDIETALQIAYLLFADPRFDADEYNQGVTQIKTILPNLESQPSYKLQEEMLATLYDSPRQFLISEEVLAKASLETIEKNYRELFKDVAGATLTVVGDFEKESIMPLIQKYMGSIAKGRKATDWSYKGDGIVDGNKVNDFKTAMQTPKVTVLQVYKVDAPYSVQAEVNYEALSYILDMVYTETMREDEGGTYGASSMGSVRNEPNAMQLLQVVFETNDEASARLRELAVEGIKSIAENGPDAEKFDKTVKNLEKSFQESKIHNSFWSNAIRQNELYGIDYAAEYEAAVKALTPDMVKATAEALLGSGNFIEIIMRPEAAAE